MVLQNNSDVDDLKQQADHMLSELEQLMEDDETVEEAL